MTKGTEEEPPDLSTLIRQAEQLLIHKSRGLPNGTTNYQPLRILASALRINVTDDRITPEGLHYIDEITSLANAYNSQGVGTRRGITQALGGLAGELEDPDLTSERAGQLAVMLGESYKQR